MICYLHTQRQNLTKRQWHLLSPRPLDGGLLPYWTGDPRQRLIVEEELVGSQSDHFNLMGRQTDGLAGVDLLCHNDSADMMWALIAQTRCGRHMISIWSSIRFQHDFNTISFRPGGYLISLWLLCDFDVISMRLQCDFNVHTMRFQFYFNTMSMWFQMISIWFQYVFNVISIRIQ